MEKVTLFSHILPEEQERMWVCFQMREVVYENNEIIMEYTNTMKKIGLIAEGQASLYGSDAEGNQYLMDELKKDDVFGEPLLLPEMSQHYYVCAKAKTRVIFIDYEHVIKRCENACKFHSQMVSNLLQMIAMRANPRHRHQLGTSGFSDERTPQRLHRRCLRADRRPYSPRCSLLLVSALSVFHLAAYSHSAQCSVFLTSVVRIAKPKDDDKQKLFYSLFR